jgi:hypothetical protein
LDLVCDEEDSVFVAEINENLEVIGRRSDESAFAQDGLSDYGCDFFVGDYTFECVFEMAGAVEIA